VHHSELIAKALENIAVKNKSSVELQDATRRIKQLEKEVEAYRSAGRGERDLAWRGEGIETTDAPLAQCGLHREKKCRDMDGK
jgi:hypothetical protein